MLGSLRRPLACSAVLVALGVLPAVVPTAGASTPGGSAGLARASAALAPTCGGERPTRPGGGRYVCSFDDDFNGSVLDRSKWYVQDTATTGFPAGVDSCYVDRPDNVAVGGGVLRLTARNVATFTCADYPATSTAATIGSVGRFAQAYGRFEFRAMFPDVTVPGVQSALWLYPQSPAYGSWPDSGEIDVAEWFSTFSDHVFPSVHYRGEDPALSTGYDCPVPGAGTGFHRYAVEWTPSRMRFLYDGRECYSHTWTPAPPLTAPKPFDQPFYLVLTQVFGLHWNAVVSETPTSATLQVDWVRAWR